VRGFGAIAKALARERSLDSLRRRGADIHRLGPPVLRPGVVRNAVARALVGGALVELGPMDGGRRVLDAVAEAAGVVGRIGGFRASTAGGIVAEVRLSGGERAILRAAGAGWPGDPAAASEALAALEGSGLPVPRLLGRGITAGASWSVESFATGTRPRKLTQEISSAVASFVAGLPLAAGGPTALERDLDRIAERLPDRARAIAEIAQGARIEAANVPAVMRHGDLWLGNVLVDGGRLSGVLDWEGWSPSAVPGADLLHLVATERRIKARADMGDIWVQRPWRSVTFRSVATRYWSAIDWTPTAEQEDLIGIAWWATEVAGTLTRVPFRAEDERWVAINIDRVLGAIAR